MNAVSIKGLKKQYGAVCALDGLNLEVAEGSVFGFLGPNGAGKTTTIRILTGLARASAGHAWVAGVEVGKGDGQLSRRIGHLPEEPAFYTWMTPEEYLDHIGCIFGVPASARKARTKELLKLVGLADARKRRIGGFSRGMRQRLGLAQALVNHPEVIFLDEPVSALDPAGRRDVLELITFLKGEATIFMSTHILADVERVCDTIGIINHGKMVTAERQASLMDKYVLPVFEVEGVPGAEAAVKTWEGKLVEFPWFEAGKVTDHTARIQVRDLEAARSGLLDSIRQEGLAINRFEAARPSLEEIFLKLVSVKESIV
jgi:ABC-2 type transport system ATP-binding protein